MDMKDLIVERRANKMINIFTNHSWGKVIEICHGCYQEDWCRGNWEQSHWTLDQARGKYICIFLKVHLALGESPLCAWKKYYSKIQYSFKFLKTKSIKILNNSENNIDNRMESLIFCVTLLLNSSGRERGKSSSQLGSLKLRRRWRLSQNLFVSLVPCCSVWWFVVSVGYRIFPPLDFCCFCQTSEGLISCSIWAAGRSMEKWNYIALESPLTKYLIDCCLEA